MAKKSLEGLLEKLDLEKLPESIEPESLDVKVLIQLAHTRPYEYKEYPKNLSKEAFDELYRKFPSKSKLNGLDSSDLLHIAQIDPYLPYLGQKLPLKNKKFLPIRAFDIFYERYASESIDLQMFGDSDLLWIAKADAKRYNLQEKPDIPGDAFGKLFERYVELIYSYIYRRVGNQEDTKDLVSKTFYRALKSLPGYNDRGAPYSAFLYRIAHNLVANFHRDRARRPLLMSIDPADDSDENEFPLIKSLQSEDLGPEEVVERIGENLPLMEALSKLSPDRQELLKLKFEDGLSNAEIASIIGKSEGAVKSLYHRTLEELRKIYQANDLPNLSFQ
ncbi:sigma-70 family RNA polymerase sigma factor [Candidatus Woesearchaeota archaeon]|nr:sigma-70 family RNA polymerase sigma factor [Candidatus Woesearchaeota archaeon]